MSDSGEAPGFLGGAVAGDGRDSWSHASQTRDRVVWYKWLKRTSIKFFLGMKHKAIEQLRESVRHSGYYAKKGERNKELTFDCNERWILSGWNPMRIECFELGPLLILNI